jgi:putative endopeptidase
MRLPKAINFAFTLTVLGLSPVLAADELASPRYGSWGFDATGMDRSVRPGADFNAYVSGGWLKSATIPADRSAVGILDQMIERSDARVHAILEDAAAGRLKDRDAARIGALYRSFMDEERADRLDDKPLAPLLATIRNSTTRRALAALMGRQNDGYAFIFEIVISPDPKAPDRYAAFLNAVGLGLPDRDYYLKESFATRKAAYQAYVQQMLEMIGWQDPAVNATAIVNFETSLAEASWTRAQLRDSDKSYHPASMDELKQLAPDFDWDAFLAASGLSGIDRVILTSDTAFPKYSSAFASLPLPALRAWFAFKLADRYAMLLSRRFVDAQFEFRGKQLNGQPELGPRWRRAAGLTNDVLGQAVGRAYVARYFPPVAKAQIDAMVAEIRKAMEARIRTLDWMSDTTKQKALEKLSRITAKIGYPAKWQSYDALALSPTDLMGNRLRANQFRWRRQVARLSQAVDHDEWNVLPQTVNAYYFPAGNEIIFTAAILQPPYFDPEADPAVNYGGVGASIGHEISHAFDDHGRKFDGKGTLTDWWTPEDASRFEAQAARLGAQYSGFEPLPGLHVNGALSMGENIGDLGGLSLALDAYRASLKGQPAPVIDGFTGEQRLFLGWAQFYRQKLRDDLLRQRLVGAPHPPPAVRVNGTIRNVDGWYSAFAIKPGDPLYIAPENRARIW